MVNVAQSQSQAALRYPVHNARCLNAFDWNLLGYHYDSLTAFPVKPNEIPSGYYAIKVGTGRATGDMWFNDKKDEWMPISTALLGVAIKAEDASVIRPYTPGQVIDWRLLGYRGSRQSLLFCPQGFEPLSVGDFIPVGSSSLYRIYVSGKWTTYNAQIPGLSRIISYDDSAARVSILSNIASTNPCLTVGNPTSSPEIIRVDSEVKRKAATWECNSGQCHGRVNDVGFPCYWCGGKERR